jgi:hypothetical protein
LWAFTGPYFGTASSRSATFALWTNAGGSAKTTPIEQRPDFRSALSSARSVRTAFARCRACWRCASERDGGERSAGGVRSLEVIGRRYAIQTSGEVCTPGGCQRGAPRSWVAARWSGRRPRGGCRSPPRSSSTAVAPSAGRSRTPPASRGELRPMLGAGSARS